MKIKAPTWAARFLLAYLALVTLTPAPYIFSGLITHIFLVVGASIVLGLRLVGLLQSHSKPTLSPYAIVLQAPLLGLLILYSLSLLLGDAIPAYDRLEALRAIAVPIIIYLLVGYLASNVSDRVLSLRLLRGIVFILSFAAIIGIFLSLAKINTLDVVSFLGLNPSNEHVERLLGVLDIRFLGLKRAQG